MEFKPLILLIAFGICSSAHAFDIYQFDPERDRNHVLSSFESDDAFLIPSLPPEEIVDKRITAHDQANYGRVTINVLYDNSQYAGFIAYYIEDEEGIAVIQYLSIESNFKKMQGATELFLNMLEDPKVKECLAIVFAVSLNNDEMLNIISDKECFILVDEDETYCYYEYLINSE